MKFFQLKEVAKSWSTQVMAAIAVLGTVDFSTTWIDAIIPEDKKGIVYAVLSAIGIIVRAIKQPSLSK